MKVTVYLEPKEFRKTLPKSLKELYDKLINSLVANGVDKSVAEYLVAKEMLNVLKEKAKKCQSGSGNS